MTINDLALLDLERREGRLVVLRDEDHLLRRFGQAEVVSLSGGTETDFRLRAVADEVWAALDGRAKFRLIDKRLGSPSFGQSQEVDLDGEQPQALLIPFGVAYSMAAAEAASLIRLATHADHTHPEDRQLSKAELAEFSISL